MIAADSVCPPEVPEHLFNGLRNFALHGLEPGGFMFALLSNDLRRSCELADAISGPAIFEIVSYIYNELPSNCWGSPEKVKAWLELGGLQGLTGRGGS